MYDNHLGGFLLLQLAPGSKWVGLKLFVGGINDAGGDHSRSGLTHFTCKLLETDIHRIMLLFRLLLAHVSVVLVAVFYTA